jgi:F-type H+-transporting ATPase subunit gamma
MGEQLEALHRRLHTAGELKSVVRTMKTLAAVSIVPYERAVRSLTDYFRTVELGLIACLQNVDNPPGNGGDCGPIEGTDVVVFGSDQGMVGNLTRYWQIMSSANYTRRPAENEFGQSGNGLRGG